ncbi:hypothetical protein NRK68_14725 [Streptomyces yangpuensis]|uniref:Uncharacterized protein n=1 Tax=Streptomyces yangpuensis TaxID=1648182 RepID=A0ABY5PWB7_9ACTN|nr:MULTISPECIES: hypothetical protein [Streptomyces]MBZ9596457.1 hypothetical protein [Streptomyces erythrochromogenes]UUY48346.1 hypothetical protein NRK68_14725 [Streptomyces yangpuensis]
MTSTCETNNFKEEAVEKRRTHSTDPEAYIRAYADSVERACCEGRSAARARTRVTLAKVPEKLVSVSAMTVLGAVTCAMLVLWGVSTAMALQVGVVSATLYSATNDVRISIVHDNPGWRRRHRFLARLIPRHPAD